jgi:uncharacterized protein (TIGR02145 family)
MNNIKLSFTLLFVLTLFVVSNSVGQDIIDQRDGEKYKTVTINGQRWMAQNLAFKVDSGFLDIYQNTDSVAKYGYFYTWEIAQNICPDGWRLPTVEDVEQLLSYYKSLGVNEFEQLVAGGNSGMNIYLTGEPTSDEIVGKDNYGHFWLADSYKDGYAYEFYICQILKTGLVEYGRKEINFPARCVKK